MKKHEKYIKQCLKLAKQGEGLVSPNPLVGAVVLDKNGKVAGTGCHRKYGEAHAEVNALNEAGERAKGGTLYVSLEPCSHFGKTPPCADLVIGSGIKTLVVGMIDPNPLVSGEGLERCKNAGIEVITGVLEDECKKLNEVFIKHITQQKPFVALKTASTMDGKIATKTGSSKWITSSAAREEVQRLRNRYDAILTGSGTVMADNPSLNCHMEGGRNPVRIVIDSRLRTNPESNVYKKDRTRIIVAVTEIVDKAEFLKFPPYVEFIRCPLNATGNISLEYLMGQLYERKIMSVLVEAGGKLNGAFVKEAQEGKNIADKIYWFIAPKILGDNNAQSFIDGFDVEDINDCVQLDFQEIKHFKPDYMIEAYLSRKFLHL